MATLPIKPPLAEECKLPMNFLWTYLLGLLRFRRYTGSTITIYGSARFHSDHPWYSKTVELSKVLADNGFGIMTGGGPGLMEAANRGAHSTGHHSLGCCMRLPGEQENNKFLDVFLTCQYFFIQKILLTRFSCAFIAAPGGYGTLDELFEILTLIRTRQINNYPVILFGKDYWAPLLDFLKNTLLSEGAINQADIDCLMISDDPNEILSTIQHSYL